jgi:hypothetical protein
LENNKKYTSIYSTYSLVWLHYSLEGGPLLVGFNYSNWVGYLDDQKSAAGYVFSFGFGLVTWAYKKQQDLVLSSTEAKYQAIVNAIQEVLWHRWILSKFGFQW